jgi:hypothetical protein
MSSPHRDSVVTVGQVEAATSGKAQKRSRCIDLPSNAVLCRAFDGLASYNSGQDGRQIR